VLNTAIILAGGMGTRLKTIISDLPKPMAPIMNVPFLTYQLNYLKHFGIKKVIFSVGYLSEKIIAHYNQSFENISIEYSIEKNPLGTGGGIRMAMSNLNEDLVLILNGDSFFDLDLEQFYNLHLEQKAEFSLALRYVNNSERYGNIEFNSSNQITSFIEKNQLNQSGYINAGVYILSKKLYLQNTKSNINFSIEKDFFEKQLNQLIIKGFEFKDYFIDIGIPEDYLKAQDDFKEFKYK
jgi:D-glycero-alpha-D-manno-heptose 1-phosphate guanylyltransferase